MTIEILGKTLFGTKVEDSAGVWFLDSSNYDVYEDFESYSVDENILSSSKWSGTGGTGFYFEAKSSTNAGGTGKEGQMRLTSANDAGSQTGTITTDTLTQNVDTFIKVYGSASGGDTNTTHASTYSVSFNGGSNYDTMFILGGENSTLALTEILVISNGNDEYDCYVGGKKVRTVTDATFEISLRATTGSVTWSTRTIYLCIDDIRQGK